MWNVDRGALCSLQASALLQSTAHEAGEPETLLAPDWKHHKPECLALRASLAPQLQSTITTPPASDTGQQLKECTAILLPFDSATPRLIRLSYTVEYDEDDQQWNHHAYPAIEKWIRTHSSIGLEYATFIPRDLPYTFCMYHDDCFLIDGSPFNRCALALAGPELGHRWGDNMIFAKVEKPTRLIHRFLDVEMGDLKYVKSFLKLYRTTT
ncbi:uncharacterized protein STEHIDRAFT_140407 [Stereum hirsutum FP-91666 SS1]|uniref:uncharacterized protein n=1 Tax=Stereum hirsutum (strain FP-91666) TaxID=721885 RepID=UPI000444A385|nr:uncharacterized protein STEHIDRAFT_140407 [Stereum hirsutum FP-91666 SS1]EIM84874.1 hypothetical protein STEHIDRAFT_140407 [Stereum hirsutum FP-91666 SS1]